MFWLGQGICIFNFHLILSKTSYLHGLKRHREVNILKSIAQNQHYSYAVFVVKIFLISPSQPIFLKTVALSEKLL